MKRNFIHHLRWTKSNILYFALTIFYFAILIPFLILSEIINPGFQWLDAVNIAVFIFNTNMFVRNMKRIQRGWEEFYLTNIDATKNIILDKTCENCKYCLYINTSMVDIQSITTSDMVRKGDCRILRNYKLKKDDLPTCKHYEEIPENVKEYVR